MQNLLQRLLPALGLAAATAMAAPESPTPPPVAASAALAMPATDDPNLWLEDVTGERALAWVRDRNAQSRRVLEAHPRFAVMRDTFRRILDSRDKVPYVSRQGDWFYNLWRDAEHPRGLWRRTTLADYRRPQPHWEPVIDLDALARTG